MQSILSNIRQHLDILASSSTTSSSKRPRGGKLERAKAAAAINDALSKKSALAALTAASTLEMVRGPQEESTTIPPLGWAELASVLLDALDKACQEALSSKSVSKSGVATLRPEYITCFRSMLKLALAHGPSGVLRGLVPTFLYSAHQWLGEPSLRTLLADHIWQCVRDILQDDANRAMLTPPFIRTWVDVCFEQLTGRGPLRHSSQVVTNLAGDVLRTLARSVTTYDTLTQSSKGISPSKMLGGDFGYAIICERCCLMLVVADSMGRREARDLQAVAFRTLTLALTDHALDVLGSNALNSIINVSLKPIITCWTDRRYRDAAVSLARILVLLAPNNKSLRRALRHRVQTDMKDESSSAVVRAGHDVKDDFVDTAAACFSFREILESAGSSDMGQGRIIVWLRVAYAIISRRVLKNGTTLLADSTDVMEQCSKCADTVVAIFQDHGTIRESVYDEIVKWSTKVIQLSASIANRIHLEIKAASPFLLAPWQKLYLVLRDQLAKMKYSVRSRGRGYGTNGTSLQSDELLLQTLSLLSTLDILENSTLDYMSASSESRRDVPYPLSSISSSEGTPSFLEVEYFRNLTARAGIADGDGGHLRFRAVHALVDLCEGEALPHTNSVKLLLDASAVALGLAHGECELSAQDPVQNKFSNEDEPFSLQALLYFQSYFAFTEGDEKISEDGPILVAKLAAQDRVWQLHEPLQMNMGRLQSSLKSLTGKVHCPSRIVSFPSRKLKHVSVDSQQSEALENQIVSKLRGILADSLHMNSSKVLVESIDVGMDEDQSPGCDASSLGFASEEIQKASQTLLFIENYLLQGLSLGVFVKSQDETEHRRRPCDELAEIVGHLMSRLAATDPVLLLNGFQVTLEVVRVACQLLRFLSNGNDTTSLSDFHSTESWLGLSTTLSSVLTNLAGSLSDHVMHLIIARTRENIERVRAFSVGRLDESLGQLGPMSRRKKKRIEQVSGRIRKKRRISSFSDSENDSIGRDNQNVASADDIDDSDKYVAGSDSDISDYDDFGDHVLRPKGIRRKQNKQSSEDARKQVAALVAKTAELLRVCAEEVPMLGENVVEVCTKGIEVVDQAERMLSPDGFERAALASDLVDPFSLELRMALWNLFTSIGTNTALATAARDVLKLGKLWRELERVAFSYVSFYVEVLDTRPRKHYPTTSHLERLRLAFLEYSRLYVERCSIGDRTMSFDGSQRQQSSHNGMRYLVSGMVDVSEYFRVKHAFRMPVLTRISYLRFGLAAIELIKGRHAESFLQHERNGSEPSVVQDATVAIQAALCKSLGDSEAAVRLVMADAVPRLISTYAQQPVSQTERLIQDNIPQNSVCVDSYSYYGCAQSPIDDQNGADEVLNPAQWALSAKEQSAVSSIHHSFRNIGASSKACAAFMSLGKIAGTRVDLLPFCILEVVFRISKRSGNLAAAYQVLARLCALLGYPSPRRLYKVFSRVLLPKWFSLSEAVKMLYEFPAALLLDTNHHRDGILFDWMRENQADLIPHLLVNEKPPSLTCITHFAEALGLDCFKMLSTNVPAFSRVFPMQFIGGFHEKGRSLWIAIDSALNNQSMQLMYKNKIEVMRAFVRSVATGCHEQEDWSARGFDPEKTLGFSRDTRPLKPPLYDALIVASAISQLVASNPNICIVPRSVLHGSLFAEVCDERSGNPIVDKYTAFLEECQRGNISLLRMLVTISRSLVGPPSPQPPQNRIDAFFCVGMLWRMMGVNVLSKSSNERVLFYKLIAKGFEHSETAHDAAWLLLDVQRRVSSMHKSVVNSSVALSHLSMDASRREHLVCMTLSRERQMYELLSTVSPILVSVIADAGTAPSSTCLLETAVVALDKVLLLCADEHLWSTILANGPFPLLKQLKHARKIYEMSKAALESENSENEVVAVVSGLQRFKGIHGMTRSDVTSMAMQASLQEIRTLLSDSAVAQLSKRMRSDAWARSNGVGHPIVELLSDVISCLVGMVRSETALMEEDKAPGPIALSMFASSDTSRSRSRNMLLSSEVLQEIANVLGILGLVHPQSTIFSHGEIHHRPIPPKRLTGSYENPESGIHLSFFLLLELLHSSSPVAAECALNAFIATLRSDDGKQVFASRKEDLEAISPFRIAARKLAVGGLPEGISIIHDPLHGEEVSIDSFPDLIDPELWQGDGEDMAAGDSYKRWMRRFGAVACANCRSAALRTLSSSCFMSYPFASSILPYLLMDIVVNADEDTLSTVSNLLQEHVLNSTSVAIPVLRSFVHALDVLCQVGLAVIHSKGVVDWFRSSPNYPQLRCQYVLQVPYLNAARAALRSGAYFSAMRYAQMHVNQKVMQVELLQGKSKSVSNRSERRLSSNPSRDQALEKAEGIAKDDVWDIVRDAMMRVNEPDGVRAFGFRESLPKAAAAMGNLDGDWSKSLGALDVAARLSSLPDITDGTKNKMQVCSEKESHGVELKTELGLFRSLLGLGTLSIATDYWSGLSSRILRFGVDQDLAGGCLPLIDMLNDLRYAAAWKLGTWESPSLLPVSGSATGYRASDVQGFHCTVYRVLHSCRVGKFADIPELLTATRVSELREFCRDGRADPGTSLFQTAAKLRISSILEDACAQFRAEVLEQAGSGSHLALPGRESSSLAHVSTARLGARAGPDLLDEPNPLGSDRLQNRSSANIIEKILGKQYGLHECDSMDAGTETFQVAFDESILAEDLPVALLRCLGSKSSLARAAATVSSRVLTEGRSGAWARAAAYLGTADSIVLGDGTDVDQIAWKLQEARLRWSSSHDAPSRKRALSAVIDVLSKDLGGQIQQQAATNHDGHPTQRVALSWYGRDKGSVQHAFLRSEACQLATMWSLDMRTDEPMNLFDRFLESGVRAVTSCPDAGKMAGRAHFAMATFADAQLSSIDAYRKSKKYDGMVSAVREVEAKIEKLKAMKSERTGKGKSKVSSGRKGFRSSRSQLASAAVTENQIGKDLDALIKDEQKRVAQDRSRLEKLNETYEKWQVLACTNFAACLRHGSPHELRAAFRMVALWLDSGRMRERITMALVTDSPDEYSDEYGLRVPVAKLLPLAPQLSSRLSMLGRVGNAAFQGALAKTIQRMAEEFPAHCLWQLLALSNATRVSANRERLASLYRGDKDKKDAADEILASLRALHGETLPQMVKVADAYIQLSEIGESRKKSSKIDIRRSDLCNLGEQLHVPVPTVPVPLTGTDFCEELPHIIKFESQASVCDGLSKPLKVVCVGSDGKEYPQLVKGRDDLRGDAVMEQMFTILNSLLEKDTEASRRSLIVRTYRIIPLSPFSGIMQFVKNTVQFKQLLVEPMKKTANQPTRRSLHERYNPRDLKNEVILMKAFEFKLPHQTPKRVQFLRTVWQRIQPAFRYFFLEQWPDPADWFAHQLAYSRSVAVMSIVGFILGLGDRHLSNILVDECTAEVVHIDFGIAFEWGKLLGTPEHMPFRLTRDLVDGFGIAGVEGVFRRCCEVTLSVMRKNKDVLLTVVEVLLHDPMFNWALTPEAVLREQPPGAEQSDREFFGSDDLERSIDDSALDDVAQKVCRDIHGSKEAQRALYRISEKLDGLEGTERLSIEAHVARLVDEAQAFHVIASVFPGWMPWL